MCWASEVAVASSHFKRRQHQIEVQTLKNESIKLDILFAFSSRRWHGLDRVTPISRAGAVELHVVNNGISSSSEIYDAAGAGSW
jgi:hypothetical protein